MVFRDWRRVLLLETDEPGAVRSADAVIRAIAFTEPPEDAARAAENHLLVRFNPVLSFQKDGDYTVSRTLCGLLSKHDRTSFGSADEFLWGWLGQSRRTKSFNKWELGKGLVARHESEARRGYTKTTLLPWGILASHASAKLPQAPEKTITRTRLLWGVGASVETDSEGVKECRVLPFGLLYRSTTATNRTSIHVLGTGFSRREKEDEVRTRFHLLGIPVWSNRREQR
jgi:hypothetical protein